MAIYGYCRISRPTQNIERQVRNILKIYPDAIIIKEIYTGTTFQGRKELDKLLKRVLPGDKIIYDSASRMARNADEGYTEYEALFSLFWNFLMNHTSTQKSSNKLSSDR